MLAMSFRAVDNYRFALHLDKLKKSQPEYFPKEPPGTMEELIEHKFTCFKKKALSAADSSATESVETSAPLNLP